MKKKATSKKKAPDRASDLPVTFGIIEEFREEMRASFRVIDRRFDSFKTELTSVKTELKAEIASVKTELKAEIAGVKTELKAEIAGVRTELKADFAGLKTEFADLKTEFADVKVDMERVREDASRTRMLVEEQNKKTDVVLDGLTSLYGRQERVESDVTELKQTMEFFKKTSR